MAEKTLVSNCCGAVVYENYDICPDCKEHCGAVESEGREFEFVGNEWKPVSDK
jgi:hypothetical protein